ncbi:MAG: hypothetical protein GQ557_02170 [Mycoplasmataceae bacterium]|nr:hypothetical protein [Mycoplasmataceae bacterium]
MFKNIIIWVIIFFTLQGITFGDTSLGALCVDPYQVNLKTFVLWWDHTNEAYNTNTKILCVTQATGYTTGIKILDYVWNLEYSQFYNYCWASGWWTSNETTIVDYFWDYYIFTKWIKTWYIGASLHVIRKNGVNNYYNLQNCGSSYGGQFTFDDDYFYFWNVTIERATWNSSNLWLGVSGAWISTGGHYVKFILSNKAIVKNFINDTSVIYAYDSLINTLLSEIITFSGVPLFWTFNIFKAWDLEQFYYSTGYKTHKIINNNTVTASFDGVLSYVSNDGVNDTLHLIPPGALVDVDFDYNKHSAYVTWSWTAKRIYYILNWTLFFNNDLSVIDSGEIIDNTWIDPGGETWTGIINIWTGSGSITYNQDIWNFDIDGDGDIELLNWEIFIWIWNVIKYYFSKMISFFSSLADLIQRLWDISTDEIKTISLRSLFFNKVHAENEIATIFNSVDKEEFKKTSIWKIDTILKWFIYFFILIFWMSFFIFVNKKKND